MRTMLVLPFLLVLVLAPAGFAGVATIETTAPLADHSEETIEAALKQAVLTAVRGAVAMGFQWVQVSQALVFDDVVRVKILASDSEPGGEDAAPEDEPEPVQLPGLEV